MSARSSDEGSQIPEKVWKMRDKLSQVRGVISRALSASLMQPLRNRHLGRRRTEHRLPPLCPVAIRIGRCYRTQFPAAAPSSVGLTGRESGGENWGWAHRSVGGITGCVTSPSPSLLGRGGGGGVSFRGLLRFTPEIVRWHWAATS